jgi:hypothetical protein
VQSSKRKANFLSDEVYSKSAPITFSCINQLYFPSFKWLSFYISCKYNTDIRQWSNTRQIKLSILAKSYFHRYLLDVSDTEFSSFPNIAASLNCSTEKRIHCIICTFNLNIMEYAIPHARPNRVGRPFAFKF